jgi:hypothetical protein
MQNIGQKTLSTIETKTVGAALHLVLRMMVMARSPSQKIFLLIISALSAKCKLFLSQTSDRFYPSSLLTLHKSIGEAYGCDKGAGYPAPLLFIS